MGHKPSDQSGWRERKQRETRQRIFDASLQLFVANGYEATTLDAIAEASGISRRTFFYYFKSKEEILLAWQDELPMALRTAMRAESTDQSPLELLYNALLKLIAHYDTHQAAVICGITHANEQLVASNQGKYLKLEEAAFEALCELWPQAERHTALRMVAMVSVNALRFAIDRWFEEGGLKSPAEYLTEALGALQVELATA